MIENRYVVSPKADQDLEDQAFYYAKKANAELGHRFLVAAHETFLLLVTQPDMGWHSRLRHPDLASLRVFRVNGFDKILVLYLPLSDGIEVLLVIHSSRNIRMLLLREGVE